MNLRSGAIATGLLATALTLGTAGLPAWSQGNAGADVFTTNCAACHGNSGEGGVGPNLAGNQGLADANHVALQIIGGGGEMPGFGDQLTDQQIADVASYVRRTWGNAFGPVTVEEVAAQRTAAAAAPAAPAPVAPAP